MDHRYGNRPPWHDAALQIQGPAVCDVAETFTQRWNDPTRLDHRNPYRALLRRTAGMPAHPEPLPSAFDPPPAAGRHAVQVLRTYPAKSPKFPFAPEGERSIARAYAHAFSRARKLIYVEDQYLWSTEVARTLAEALEREPALHVIAVVPRYPDQDGRISGPPNRLGQIAAMQVLSAAGGDRFAVYDLTNELGVPIYVHAKVCVVDDEWMTCGSDNFNRRSWTHDSEATCAVVDPDGVLPRQVRTSLWSEHLGLAADDPRLLNLDDAAALWHERSANPAVRARPHRPDPLPRMGRVWAGPLYRLAYDPDGRRMKQRRTGRF
jgi:phosphatidylserine/phosphatidylglycerophosphate/cardiolipin synthase-like enzyme